ncbi:SH3 domain-containing protein, partial [Phycomyces nitens]
IISMVSARFRGCYARALYDFCPETEYETSMKKGEVVWIQHRQCRGWLVADVNGQSGLIPESYVERV